MVKGWDIELLPDGQGVELVLHHGRPASWVVRLTKSQVAMIGVALCSASAELQRAEHASRQPRTAAELGAHRVS